MGQIALMHARAFGSHRKPEELESYLTEIFFEHPWLDESLPSLGCVDESGRLVGCLGSMPRPMTFRGEPINALVTHNFMVDPSSRSTLAAIQLKRAIAAPTVDLIVAEPNEAARKISEAMGGAVIWSRSRRWLRVFSPGALGARTLRPGASGVLGSALHGLGSAFDTVARHLPRVALEDTEDQEHDASLSPATLLELLGRLTPDASLRPVYSVASLTWMFTVLGKTRRKQSLRSRTVMRDGTEVGWYVYYSRPDGVGRVLQIGARSGEHSFVLDRLFADALRLGNFGLSGQAEPGWEETLKARSCLIRERNTWLVAHTRSADIRTALEADDAIFSRLEGESWLRFAY